MGFVKDAVGGLLGSGAKAAKGASKAQVASVERARNDIAAGVSRATAALDTRLAPYAQEGLDQLLKLNDGNRDDSLHQLGIRSQWIRQDADQLEQFVKSPEEQRQYVTANPFFKALTDDAQRRLFNNEAAKGKVGSGGTAEALQNSLLLLGTDLINNTINQRVTALNAEKMGFDTQASVADRRLGLVGLGQNSAATQATGIANAEIGGAQAMADLATQGGNAKAAGIVGARNAQTNALGNAINTGIGIAGLMLSDERTKTDIKEVGKTKGGNKVYTYRYKHAPEQVHMGVMAQEVEKKNPDAVKTIAGLKLVDYSEVA